MVLNKKSPELGLRAFNHQKGVIETGGSSRSLVPFTRERVPLGQGVNTLLLWWEPVQVNFSASQPGGTGMASKQEGPSDEGSEVTYRRYFRRNGKVYDAHDYGYEAWPIPKRKKK